MAMQTRNRIIAAFASALLLGGTFVPAAALTVSLNNGIHVNSAPNATGFNVNGGSGTTIASADAQTKRLNEVDLAITNANDDLINLRPKAGDTTTGAVNLGSVDLSGLDVSDIDVSNLLGLGKITIPPVVPPPVTVTPGGLGGGYAALSGGDQALLKIKCRSVLANPSAFDSNVVTLCRLIAGMAPAG
jgi:hypothetical protein